MPTSAIKKENEAATSFSFQNPTGAFKMIFINRLYNFFRPDYFAKENEIKLRIRQRQDEVAFLELEHKRLKLKEDRHKWLREHDRYKNFHQTVAADFLKQAGKAQKQLDELMNGQVRHG